MSMGKRRRIDGDEQDATTHAHHRLLNLDRAGATAGIKRRICRRDRREAKHEVRQGPYA